MDSVKLFLIVPTVFFLFACTTPQKGEKFSTKERETESASETQEQVSESEGKLAAVEKEEIEKPVIRSINLINSLDETFPTVDVGAICTLEVTADRYEVIEYDFRSDGAFQTDNTFTYDRFGVKTITVRAKSERYSTEQTYDLRVKGSAEVIAEPLEIQHDRNGGAVVTATLDGEGDYDTVRLFYDERLLIEAQRAENYQVHIGFVGERTFDVTLFHRGVQVADCNPVNITGLNDPPILVGEFSKIVPGSVGEELSFVLAESVEDPNSDPLLFEIMYAPEGAAFNRRTGRFQWTPQETGFFLVEFTVSDFPYGEGEIWLQRMLAIQ